MRRLQLIEIQDLSWCPGAIRDGVTDYLQFCHAVVKPYQPALPILARALQQAGSRHILDLCSGGAGPWLSLQPALAGLGLPVTVCLSDKYPNLDAFHRSTRVSNQAITCHPRPVDATRVPAGLDGFRTIFTAFHHFTPDQGRAVLADAVRERRAIAIFEATARTLRTMVLMLLVPFGVLVVTPWIRPFRWTRLFWTYLVPAIGLVAFLDGIVSCLRTYRTSELRELIDGVGATGYQWQVGEIRADQALTTVTYAIGIPEPQKAEMTCARSSADAPARI